MARTGGGNSAIPQELKHITQGIMNVIKSLKGMAPVMKLPLLSAKVVIRYQIASKLRHSVDIGDRNSIIEYAVENHSEAKRVSLSAITDTLIRLI